MDLNNTLFKASSFHNLGKFHKHFVVEAGFELNLTAESSP